MDFPTIDEALDMNLDELAPFGDFGGVMIAKITEDTSSEDVQLMISNQLTVDRSTYYKYNVTSLGNMARIIVSGQNPILVSKAQEIYDDYKRWYQERENNSLIHIVNSLMNCFFNNN